MTTITFGTGGDFATLKLAVESHDFSTGSALFTQVGASTSIDIQITSSIDFNGNVCWIKGDSDYATTCSTFMELSDSNTGDVYIEGLDLTCTLSMITTSDTLTTVNGLVSVFNNKLTVYDIIDSSSTTYRTYYIYNNEIEESTKLFGGTYRGAFYFEDNMYQSCLLVAGSPVIEADDATTAGNYIVKRNYIGDTRIALFDANVVANTPNITTEFFVASASTEVVAGNRSLLFNTTNFNSIVDGVEYGVPKSESVMTTTATQGTAIPTHSVGANGVTITTWAVGPYKPRVYLNLPLNVTVENIQSGAKITWTNNTETGYERTYLYWETISVDEAFATPKTYVESGISEYTIPYDQLESSSIWYLRVAHGA